MQRHLYQIFSILVVVALLLPAAAVPAAAQTQGVETPGQPVPKEAKSVTPVRPSRQMKPATVPVEEAIRKLHPDLRDLVQEVGPALPTEVGPQATRPQAPLLVEVIARPMLKREGKDFTLDSYFVDGKVLARPVFGKEGAKKQILIGQVNAADLLKIASLSQVEAVIPIVLERNGEPDPYPPDDPRPIPQKGPEDWAQLRANADKIREGMLPWNQAKAFGDGRPDIKPYDWFEVMPEGPHKAQAAWDRGYTGEGVTVAVLDDGVDFAHADLLGTQKIYSSTIRPKYNGWPYVFSPISMLLYALDNFFGTTYIADGFPGAHYVDTSFTPTITPCGTGISCFKYTPLIDYGVPGIEHTYVISNTMSKSGVVHVGTHPDNDLRDFLWGEKVAILVADPNTAGVYDTVYVDLDNDYDFRDEKPLTRADVHDPMTYNDMIAYRDVNADGIPDISGGAVYFIADGVTPIPASDWLYGPGLAPPPANGDLVAITGSTFDRAYSHGTQCASNIVGQGRVDGMLPSFRDLPGSGKPAGAVFGMAPDAKVVNISDIYYNFDASKIDAYIFAAVGYDACDQAGIDWLGGGVCTDSDAIQITTNSYGSSDEDNDGWEYDGQVVSQVQRYYAPFLQFLFSTGNGASAYGTVAPPSPATGIGVGASTEFGSTGWDSITDTTQIMFNDVTPFSNRGPGARGTNGVDVVAGGAFAAGDEELNYYSASMWGAPDGNLSWATWGGTSRSAPVAGGVLALLYQAYADANGAWPTFDIAKALLKSSATDLNYDTFTQGAGSVNADRGTAVAGGEYGLVVFPDEWNPGDYRGEDYPGFAHIAYPGDLFTTTIDIMNTGVETITASIADAEMILIAQEEFSFTVTPDMVAAESAYGDDNRDNFFKAFNYFIPITATAGMDPSWYNIAIPPDTDLMIVRQMFPYDQFDANGDYKWDNRFYLVVYNWQDVNGDGNVWEDKDGNGVVNFINSGVISQIDGGEELDWNDPRTEIDRWEFGRFSYHRPGGNRNEMWVHDPLDRMIDGIFIGLRHHPGSTYAMTTTLQYRIEFYKKTDVPWLITSASSVQVAPYNTAQVVVTATVPMDMPAGEYEAGIYVEDPGWMTYTAHTSVIPVVLSVAEPFTEGMQLGGYDTYNSAYNAGHPYNNAAVRGLFDWLWRAESGDWRFFFSDLENCVSAVVFQEDFEGTFPPAGWQVVDNAGTGNIWFQSTVNHTNGSGRSAAADSDAVCNWLGWDTELWSPSLDLTAAVAPVLTYESNFQDYIGAGDAWLDVSTDGGMTWTNLSYWTDDHGPTQEVVDLSAYAGQTIILRWRYSDNNDGCAWYWHIDDVTISDVSCAYPAGTKLLVRDQWDDAAPYTDIDTIVLGPTPTSLGSGWYDFAEPTFYGPYTLDTVGSSPNTNAGGGVWRFNTSSGTNEDWVLAPLPDWRVNRDGLHEFLQHNVLFNGTTFDVVFTKTIGTLQEDPHTFVITTYQNSGVLGTATIQPGLDLNGLEVDGYLIEPHITDWVNEPLAFVSSSSIEWVYVFNIANGVYIQADTNSADISDIDLYLYWWNGSGWQLMASSLTSTAAEHVRVEDPPDGQWLIGINNYSGPAGHFDLTLDYGINVGGLSFSGVPTGTIAAGMPVSFTVSYSYPMMANTTYGGVVLVGPPEAPSLKEIPVTITRLPESAMVEKSVNYATAFPGNELDYTVTLYNLSDPAAFFEFSDPIPMNTDFVTVTGSGPIAPVYDAANNRVVYTGTLPLASVYETYLVDDTSTTASAEWIEASISGTQVTGWDCDDGHLYPISVTFPFTYYNATYSEFAVGSNGTIYFEDVYLGLSNTPIPGSNTYGVDTFLALFWDDLSTCSGGVYYLEGGAAPNRWLVIEFKGVNRYGYSTPLTFEAILYESGIVKFLYKDVGDSGYTAGGSATVGLQENSTSGVQYSYNTESLYDDLAIVFTPTTIYVPSAQVNVTVRISDTAAPDSWITNTAMLTATHLLPQEIQSEPPASAQAVTHIGAEDFATSYKAATPQMETGGVITYEVHVINSGDKLAYVTFTDTLPVSLTLRSLDNDPPYQQLTYSDTLHALLWAGNIAPGDEWIFSFEMNVPADGTLWWTTITNTAQIAWDGKKMTLEAGTYILPGPNRIYLPLVTKK